MLINILVKFTLLIFLKFIFSEFFILLNLVFFVGFFSYIFGILLTLYQKKLIRILSFGSVSNIGLIVMSYSLIEIDLFSLIFLGIYLISLYKFIYLLDSVVVNLKKLIYVTDLSLLLDFNVTCLFSLNILEIGGFPPLNIFIFKLIFLIFLIKNNLLYLTIVILLFSLFSTYYYLRMIKNLFYDLNSFFTFLKITILYKQYWFLEYLFFYPLFFYPKMH
jgi:NADH-quinone oxidoreductase subunit N